MMYYMLNPKDITECYGTVSDEEVMDELNLTPGRFKNLVERGYDYYHNSLLVEVAPDVKRCGDQFEEIFLCENEKGQVYYACIDCTVKKIYRNKSIKIMKPWKRRNQWVIKINGKEVSAQRLFAKVFIDNDLSKDQVVVVEGNELKLENIKIYSVHDWSVKTGFMSSKSRRRIVGYYEDGILVKKYKSARSAAKDLFCSYQTVLDICNKKVKKPPLIDVRYIEG